MTKAGKKNAGTKKPSKLADSLNRDETLNSPETVAAGELGNPNFVDAAPVEASEKTLYLKVDANGTPLWSRMKPESIDTWRATLQHPASVAQFGAAETAAPIDTAPQKADAEALLGWLAAGEALVFSRLTGLDLRAAGEICAYTPAELEQLSPRLARLMGKHGGDWMAKYGDELFFAAALGGGVFRRYAECRKAVIQQSPTRSADQTPANEVQTEDPARVQ